MRSLYSPASRPPGILAQRLRTLGEAGVRNQTWKCSRSSGLSQLASSGSVLFRPLTERLDPELVMVFL